MKDLINKAKDYVNNPANSNTVAIAAGVALGVAIVPLTVKALAYTAGQAIVVATVSAAAGYATYQGVQSGQLQAMLARAKQSTLNQ